MSAAGTPPARPTRDALVAALEELCQAVGEFEDDIRGINDEEYGPRICHALLVTGNLLEVHLPEPNYRVVLDLDILWRGLDALSPPPEDDKLEARTVTRRTIRRAVAGLWAAVRDVRTTARRAYPGVQRITGERRPRTEIDRERIAAVLAGLDAFEHAVSALRTETDTAPDFIQQGEIVTYYVRGMTLQVNLARMHLTVNDVSLDIPALLDTIENVRDVSARFRATVIDWTGRVTDALQQRTEDVTTVLARLMTGVRVLAGMAVDGGHEAVVGPDMLLIPAGEFIMGSSEIEMGQTGISRWEYYARPRHKVTIPRSFLLGRYPVTRGEYAVFARETNRPWPEPDFQQTDRHPAVMVGFDDVAAYSAWLSERLGVAFRLPTEAEWEYACRAGTVTSRWWGDAPDTSRANVDGRHHGTTPVDAYDANPWGLRDMLGNVYEWCEDHWHDDYTGAPTDGSAWITDGDPRRVVRGGSWINNHMNYRADHRYKYPGDPSPWVGFRLARTI
jgi:formylglycine-generating enzyme required for sulfatase activity